MKVVNGEKAELDKNEASDIYGRASVYQPFPITITITKNSLTWSTDQEFTFLIHIDLTLLNGNNKKY